MFSDVISNSQPHQLHTSCPTALSASLVRCVAAANAFFEWEIRNREIRNEDNRRLQFQTNNIAMA
jgi:hypothetical protein